MAGALIRPSQIIATAILCIACAVPAAARDLPTRLVVPSPFPQIVAQAPTVSFVAPGITEGAYDLLTPDGPITVRVVAIAPHRADVHLGTVLAHDLLTSAGETISSMAARTGAVAGINGDYFDINNTNRPLNVLVRDGELLRIPRKRYALAIARDGTPRFAEFSFTGTLQVGATSTTLDAVNEYPAGNGGTSIITPEFGSVPPAANVTLVALERLDGTPPFARYRVTAITDNGAPQPPGFYLAIGINAYGTTGVPDPGDVVVAAGDFASGDLGATVAAIGGGPLILHDGAWYDDADGPRGGEFLTRIPSSGAAIEPDGTLLLIEVDGRQPDTSIGLTRPQFAALMRAFGATEGMAFDGGGSSTIVARELGETTATLQNSPSDGRERAVADGLFVYSDAPVGPPTRIVARPGTIRAMPGAQVPLDLSVVDDAGHAVAATGSTRAAVDPASLGTYVAGAFTASKPGHGVMRFTRGVLHGSMNITVVAKPARLEIVPNTPNLIAGGHVQFVVRAYDANGFAVVLPRHLAWSAFQAGTTDAVVVVRGGDAVANERVTVGQHEAPLAIGTPSFATSPRGGVGSLAPDSACGACYALTYDFSGNERAVYANVDVPLPAAAIGVAFDLTGDGNGETVRIAVLNAINERVMITAAIVDFQGTRRVAVTLPRGFAGPGKLASIYVLDGIGPKRVQSAGSVTFGTVRVIMPGTPPGSP